MEREILIKNEKYEDFVNNLTRFLLNTETFDQFADQFLSSGGDEVIFNLKNKMSEIKVNHQAICKIVSGSATAANDQDFMEYIDLFRNHKYALTEYYDIDPDFVIDTVKELNYEIARLMNEFSRQIDAKSKLVYVSVSFIILNAIPSLPMRDLIGTNYEMILNNYLCPEIQALSPLINPNHIINTITLPFAKLEKSTLEKCLAALQRSCPDYLEKFHLAVFLALCMRSFDDEIFLDTLKTVHEFYEAMGYGLNDLVPVLLARFCHKRDYYLARKVFNFCRDHKLLPKTIHAIAEEYVSNFSTNVDAESFSI